MSDIPDDVIEAARVLNMRLHSATELGQRTQWIAEALMAERERSSHLLSEAEKRESEARSPFEIVADWHDRQARTFKEMAQDVRAGELGRAKAIEASKHHAGSAAALRLHVLNERRSALQSEER